ncbi:glycogen/starch/alpha-glucan phosphorylase, partial [Burkholderia sp. SIMBA_057]
FALSLGERGEVDARFVDKRAWTESAIENVAGMGQFSSDRTIGEYARDIWRVSPLDMA